jgi:hypothetical protein
MLTFLILLVTWMIIGIAMIVPGVTLIWTDYEINGFSMKLVLMILLFGPLFWLGIIALLILYSLDIIFSQKY